MAYFNFVNNSTPINDTNLNAMQKGLIELVFPIGSTYTTQTDTNPNTILGFGTWERFKGLVALGLDEDDTNLNLTGKTGGEKTHTLTQSEAPSNTVFSNGLDGETWSPGKWNTYNGYNLKSEGGQAHNNMQPYEIVGYMWIRRA